MKEEVQDVIYIQKVDGHERGGAKCKVTCVSEDKKLKGGF